MTGSTSIVLLVTCVVDVSATYVLARLLQTITDYKGAEQGTISVGIVPCNADGTSLTEDFFIEEPSELIGSVYHIKVLFPDCCNAVRLFECVNFYLKSISR